MIAPYEHKRRDVRYRASVPVMLIIGRRGVEAVTEDLSFRGLFVRTDTPPALRNLLRVEVKLPSGAPFRAMVVAVWSMPAGEEGRVPGEEGRVPGEGGRVPGEGGRVPGVGLQFYGLSRAEASTWEKFVGEVARRQTEASAQPASPAAPPRPEPIRRQHPRHTATFKVVPKDLDALVELYTRDISRGGMFVLTDLDLKVGHLVNVEIVHPQTEEVFPLHCGVRHVRAGGPHERGVGLKFLDLDAVRREQFYGFIHRALLREECEGVVEDLDDPKLA